MSRMKIDPEGEHTARAGLIALVTRNMEAKLVVTEHTDPKLSSSVEGGPGAMSWLLLFTQQIIL